MDATYLTVLNTTSLSYLLLTIYSKYLKNILFTFKYQALRTAAGSALATDYLAKKDATVLTVFGAGLQVPLFFLFAFSVLFLFFYFVFIFV